MTKAEQEHRERTTRIANQLGDEYAVWYGQPDFSRYLALGEYILEETNSDQPHDEWLMAAREAYLHWKKDHQIETPRPGK